ncbi:MAG: nitrilase-related carbon-nitrogen hydrolase, partial [Ferruginibacter sp.]
MSSLTITTIQTDLHWENSSANLLMFEEKLRTIEGKTEIVLLPEMFSTGFSMRPQHLAETMEGNSVTWMRDMATKHRIVLGGSLIIEEEGRFYNRFVWMLPTGLVGYYGKRLRFAFAGEDQHYTAGEER